MVLCVFSVALCVTKKIRNLHRDHRGGTTCPDLSGELHRVKTFNLIVACENFYFFFLL